MNTARATAALLLLFAASAAPAVTYQEVIETADAHWPMQEIEGTQYVATSGQDLGIVGGTANQITTVGPLTEIPRAAALRGYSHYMTSTTGSGQSLPAATLCVWLKREGDQVQYTRIYGRDNQFNMLMTGGILSYNWSGSSSQFNFTGPVIPDGVWTHVALRIQATKAEFFIDGVLAATNVTSHPQYTQSATTLTVGRNPAVLQRWYNGDLTDLQMYHRVLTQDEITAVALGPEAGSVEVGDALVRELTPVERAEYGEATEFLAPGWKRFLWTAGAAYNSATKTISNDGNNGPRLIQVGLEGSREGSTIYLLVEISGDARGQVALNTPDTFFESDASEDFYDIYRFFPQYDDEKTNNNTEWTPEESCARGVHGTLTFFGSKQSQQSWYHAGLTLEEIKAAAEACGCYADPVSHPFGNEDPIVYEYEIRISCPQQNCDADGIDDRQDDDLSECDIEDCDGDGIPDDQEDDPCGESIPEWPGSPPGVFPPDPDGSASDSASCPLLIDPTDQNDNTLSLPIDILYRIQQDGCWDIDADGICDQCDADARGYYSTCPDGTCFTRNTKYHEPTGQDLNISYFVDVEYCLPCADSNENGICDDCEGTQATNLETLYKRFRILIDIVNFDASSEDGPFCPTWQISERLTIPYLPGASWYFDWSFRTCFDYRPQTVLIRYTIRGTLLWMLNILAVYYSFCVLWRM